MAIPLQSRIITPPPRDHVFLRAAFALAVNARSHGDFPSGAVLVNAVGEVVGWGESSQISRSDCCGHAEMNLIRHASRHRTFEQFGTMTLYTTVEPCVMCTGAICLSGIRRVVYGMTRTRLAELLHSTQSGELPFTCREMLAQASRIIDINGPMLEDEAESAVVQNESSL